MEQLTERELAVLRYLPTQLSRREIAAELYVSLDTLETHCSAVYRELGVTDRTLGVHVSMEAEQASHASDPSSHHDEACQDVLIVATQRHIVQFVNIVLELIGDGVERVGVPVEQCDEEQRRGQATDLALILGALVVEERDRIGCHVMAHR